MIEDLEGFLTDMGVSVIWEIDEETTVEALGIFDMPDSLQADGLVMSTEYTLTVIAAEFPGLRVDEVIEVDGNEYYVRDVRKVDDGKFFKVRLSEQ